MNTQLPRDGRTVLGLARVPQARRGDYDRFLDRPQDADGHLAPVLRDMAAPGTADELAGEEAAVAAFVTGAPRREACTARRAVLRVAPWSSRPVRGARAAVLAVAASALGGVAVAAGTAQLPRVFTSDATPKSGVDGQRPVADARTPPAQPTVRPMVADLCRAFLGGDPEVAGGWRYRVLVRAAGGNGDVVYKFCVTAVGTQQTQQTRQPPQVPGDDGAVAGTPGNVQIGETQPPAAPDGGDKVATVPGQPVQPQATQTPPAGPPGRWQLPPAAQSAASSLKPLIDGLTSRLSLPTEGTRGGAQRTGNHGNNGKANQGGGG